MLIHGVVSAIVFFPPSPYIIFTQILISTVLLYYSAICSESVHLSE
jgi:hypothetical protein